MQKDLDEAKARRLVVLELIYKGEIHPDPDWSWDCEVICLEHDISVLEFAVERGYTDFNTACEQYYQSLLNDEDF